jgi:hypothetical protein
MCWDFIIVENSLKMNRFLLLFMSYLIANGAFCSSHAFVNLRKVPQNNEDHQVLQNFHSPLKNNRARRALTYEDVIPYKKVSGGF